MKLEGTLSEISIYPIKSVRGIDLPSAPVESRGLQNDRRFMLVTPDGKFITGREHPRLLRIACTFDERRLRIEAPDMDALSVEAASGDPDIEAVVWKSSVTASLVSADADEWFSTYLGMPCRLVFMGEESRRAVSPDYGQPEDEVSFADAYPILIVSHAALDELNSRLDIPFSMRQFRPNLVVADCDAHAEDEWRRIRIGEVELELVKRCDRCVLTTIDPETAEKHAQTEPLRTLGTYRRGNDGKIYFGKNAIPRTAGVVRVGDQVTVLE